MTAGGEVEAFARRYFERQGEPLLEEEPGVFRARLPESLRPAFGGAESLRIAFDPAKVASGGPLDLVAVGSYLLDRIVEDSTRRGWHTVARLGASGEPPADLVARVLRPGNATVAVAGSSTESVPHLLFNFRVRLTTDERVDKFESVLIDARTLKERRAAPSLFEERLSLPEDVGFDWTRIDEAYRAACKALEARVEREANGIRAHAESLRDAEVDRITRYFASSVREALDSKASDGRGEARALELERDRRLAEAQEKYRFVGEAELCNVRTVLLDVTKADAVLDHRGARRAVTVEYDAATSEIPQLPCEVCGAPMEEPLLCFGGHLTGRECARTCDFCDRIQCGKCAGGEGLTTPCTKCRRSTCADHLEVCALSGKPYCPDHIHACAICGRTVGPEYVVRCESCEQGYCAACVAPPAERCGTCRALVAAAGDDPLIAKVRREDPALAKVTKWKRASNQRYTVALAKGLVWNVLLVLDPKGSVLVRKKVLGG